MEKKEAIREWCVEKTLAFELSKPTPNFSIEKLLELAEKLEKYITS